MKLVFTGETVYLKINGKLVKMEAGADVEVEFPHIDRDKFLRDEIKRIKKGGK